MTEYLPPPELHELTGYKPRNLQDGWLTEHGIPHRVDGARIIVSREHVRAWLEGRTVVQSAGINWAAVK